MDASLEKNDPWEGLVYYLEHLFGMQAGDRGFNDFLSRRFTDSAETERIHDEMCQQIVDMLTRAQETGQARRDITLADIVNLPTKSGDCAAMIHPPSLEPAPPGRNGHLPP